MKILKDDHCPNCGVSLSRVRNGIAGTPCGIFHQHPGVAKLVVDVVNNERDDISATLSEHGDVVTAPLGMETYENVQEAVEALLEGMNEIIFPDD